MQKSVHLDDNGINPKQKRCIVQTNKNKNDLAYANL